MEKTDFDGIRSGRIFLWKFNRESIIVPAREIIYLHTEQRKVFVHTTQGVYRIGGTLKSAVRDVEGLPMLRTHASYVVHLEYLRRISRHGAVLKNGESLPVSEKCWRRIRPFVEAYVTGMKNGSEVQKSVDIAKRLC